MEWPVADIEKDLRNFWPDFSAEVVTQTDSTNTQLLARIRRGQVSPYLLVTETQTQGRGRQEKPWFSAAGDTLMFSLLLPCPENAAQGMAIAVGCSLIQALDPHGNTLKLKWPNDIYYQHPHSPEAGWRKLSGILIETATYAHKRYAVIGIGVNITQPPQEGSYRIPAGYLAELTPQVNSGMSATTVLPSAVHFVAQALYNFNQDGLKPWIDFFDKKDLLAGQMLETTDMQLRGVGSGIDMDGRYLLKTADGSISALHSTEVSIRTC